MHPRVCLHQVAFLDESTAAFVDHCRGIGVQHVTLVTQQLMRPGGVEEAQRALAASGTRVATINHPFATFPNLESDTGEAAKKLLQAIDIAATLGAQYIYVLTGGRGSLTWEQAAELFAELVAEGKAAAESRGVTLLVENASVFNADIHMVHTLADTIALAEIAGVGLCIDFHACWMEAGLRKLIERAMPITGLVQLSELGDRSAPCRAVPGDGAIPLERIVGDVLATGYAGVFDLVGPRIEAEGARPATTRAAENLSTMLTNLGA